jgi:hypothetical protein
LNPAIESFIFHHTPVHSRSRSLSAASVITVSSDQGVFTGLAALPVEEFPFSFSAAGGPFSAAAGLAGEAAEGLTELAAGVDPLPEFPLALFGAEPG